MKRILDRRRYVVLTDQGVSRFHTTSVENLAELAFICAQAPAMRVLNCGDPHPPTVLEIEGAIATALDLEWTEVLMPRFSWHGPGATPWSIPRPMIVDMREAETLGYQPVTRYEEAVGDGVRRLLEATREQDWRQLMHPSAVDYLGAMFDYQAEEQFLSEVTCQAPTGGPSPDRTF